MSIPTRLRARHAHVRRRSRSASRASRLRPPRRPPRSLSPPRARSSSSAAPPPPTPARRCSTAISASPRARRSSASASPPWSTAPRTPTTPSPRRPRPTSPPPTTSRPASRSRPPTTSRAPTSATGRSTPAPTATPRRAQLTGPLTLDAQGDPNAQFVFEIASTLTTASASSVVLVNGAAPCNVFWQVGSSATLGTTTAFQGNLMALTSISLNNGATVIGRLLARNGAVSLINNVLDSTPLRHRIHVDRRSAPARAPGTARARRAPARARRRGCRQALIAQANQASDPKRTTHAQRHDDASAHAARDLHRRVPRDGPRQADQARRLHASTASASRACASRRSGCSCGPCPARTRVTRPRHVQGRHQRQDAALGYRACADAVAQPDDRPVGVHRMRRLALDPARRDARRGRRRLAVAGPVRATAPQVAVTQPLVILLQDHVARASAEHAGARHRAGRRRAAAHACAPCLPVLGAVKGKDGNRWVHVRLPGRPSGHTGWILADQTIRVVHRVAHRRRRDGAHASPSTATACSCAAFPAVVRKALDADAVRPVLRRGGARALAARTSAAPTPWPPARARTSSRSSRAGRARSASTAPTASPEPLGSAASHGCIRLSPSAITWLAKRIGAGVPVTVER